MQIFKRHQAIWSLLAWKKAPSRPFIIKSNLIKSSCDSECKLPEEKCRNILRTNRFTHSAAEQHLFWLKKNILVLIS